MRILPLVVIAAVAAPALADPPTQIVGRVLDNTKKHPVVGATVTLGGFTSRWSVLNAPAGTSSRPKPSIGAPLASRSVPDIPQD